MSDHAITENGADRAHLLPVVGGIAGLYLAIITVAYFVGNMIHQIP
ncbi:MAG: hypothetical protein ACE37N_10545 [Pseudohongiellaceae bacterium]|jgi:hypothetical protein